MAATVRRVKAVVRSQGERSLLDHGFLEADITATDSERKPGSESESEREKTCARSEVWKIRPSAVTFY